MKIIEEILGDFKDSNYTKGITEENIQSRLRELLLMALSNRYGYMVLAAEISQNMQLDIQLYGDV